MAQDAVQIMPGNCDRETEAPGQPVDDFCVFATVKRFCWLSPKGDEGCFPLNNACSWGQPRFARSPHQVEDTCRKTFASQNPSTALRTVSFCPTHCWDLTTSLGEHWSIARDFKSEAMGKLFCFLALASMSSTNHMTILIEKSLKTIYDIGKPTPKSVWPWKFMETPMKTAQKQREEPKKTTETWWKLAKVWLLNPLEKNTLIYKKPFGKPAGQAAEISRIEAPGIMAFEAWKVVLGIGCFGVFFLCFCWVFNGVDSAFWWFFDCFSWCWWWNLTSQVPF